MLSLPLSFYTPVEAKKGSLEIKREPEDFIVEEITKEGQKLKRDKPVRRKGKGGPFTWFVLQKRNWGTDMAIRAMAKALRVSQKRFNYAGTKDKRAVTVQLVSAWQVEEKALLSLSIADMKVLGAWRMPEKVHMGQLLGNAFTIRGQGEKGEVERGIEELSALGGFPNYYGIQRFGNVRRITHIIGYYMVKGDFETAVRLFLTYTEGEENRDAREARLRLAEEWDFSKALSYFPKFLKHERLLLSHLQHHPRDYVNAFRKLPLQTRLLFIHALQGYIFNALLSERLKEGELEKEEGEYYAPPNFYGFPDIERRTEKKEGAFLVAKVIGYKSELSEREREMLDRLSLSKEDFRVGRMPEVGSEGTYRVLIAPFKAFSHSHRKGQHQLYVELPRGSYATVFLEQLFRVREWRPTPRP